MLYHQEQVPRKQGLKPLRLTMIIYRLKHQEQVPRKQGLKPSVGAGVTSKPSTSRASSTKTRIETSR